MTTPRPWLALAGLLLTLPATRTFAQTPADKARADKVFREGREAAKRGEFAQACSLFAESQRLDPTAGTLINLADCSEKLGDLVAARGHLQQALGRLKPTDDRVPVVQKRLTALEEVIPRLVVRLPTDSPAGLHLEVDGREVPLAEAGQPALLPPGMHEVTLTVGDQRTRVQVRLELGRLTEARPDVPKPPPPPPVASVSASPPPPVRGSWERPVGITLAGVGAASLVGALVVALAVLPNRKDTVREQCGSSAGFADPKACTSSGADAASSGRAWSVALNVALGLGIVAAGTGTYLLVSAPSGPKGSAFVGLGGRF